MYKRTQTNHVRISNGPDHKLNAIDHPNSERVRNSSPHCNKIEYFLFQGNNVAKTPDKTVPCHNKENSGDVTTSDVTTSEAVEVNNANLGKFVIWYP